MNKLQLVQRYARDIKMTTIPDTTVVSASTPRDWQRAYDYIDEAWLDIQTEREDWDWMLSSRSLGGGASFPTVANQFTYELGVGAGTIGIAENTFRAWKERTFRCYLTSIGTRDEQYLGDQDFDVWQNTWEFNANRQAPSRPTVVAIGPRDSLSLGPAPDAAGYTITGDYWLKATQMAADADVPTNLPEEYHLAIVYGAMKKYGGRAPAPEIFQVGDMEYARYMNMLTNWRLPRLRMARPLA